MVRSPAYMEVAGKEVPMIELVRSLSGRQYPTDSERLAEIVQTVRGEKRTRAERSALPGALVGGFFHGMAAAQMTRLDANYRVSDACAGCGTCTRVCPRGNVRRETGTTSWHHDCDNCGACITWCPRHAISYEGMPNAPRRHHPDVTAADLMWESA